MSVYGGWPKGFKITRDFKTYMPKRIGTKPRSKWQTSYLKYKKIRNDDDAPIREILKAEKWYKLYKRLLALPLPKRGRPRKGSVVAVAVAAPKRKKSKKNSKKLVKRKLFSLAPTSKVSRRTSGIFKPMVTKKDKKKFIDAVPHKMKVIRLSDASDISDASTISYDSDKEL